MKGKKPKKMAVPKGKPMMSPMMGGKKKKGKGMSDEMMMKGMKV